MKFIKTEIKTEKIVGEGPSGCFFYGDAGKLLHRLKARPNLIYIDPPFMTGRDFFAYDDRWQDQESYYRFMEDILKKLHAALDDDGSLFLHVDFRAQAGLKLLLDQIFGRDAFRNEIIWAYQSGGRSKKYFARKHDTIFYYAKSENSFFDPMQAAVPRGQARKNHMKREVDEQGRAFTSIRSNGKVYRYYEDEPVPPGDVWDDISHLQQRDPERNGYPTQKPLRLLDRIIRCASKEDGLVLDCFAGSGTALEAAAISGRGFIGMDAGFASLCTVRKRMQGRNLRLHVEGAPQIKGEIGFVALEDGRIMPVLEREEIAVWSLGSLSDGEYVHETQLITAPGEAMGLPQGIQNPAVFVQTESGQGVWKIEL